MRDDVVADLAVLACRSLCSWRRSEADARDGRPLFACGGCGSQWVPGAGWTPVDADGRTPEDVRRARDAFHRRQDHH